MTIEQSVSPTTELVKPLPRREWTALVSAIILAIAVNIGPVHEWAEQSFSAHMLQHMVLIVIVAPLLAIAWPFIEEMIGDALAAMVDEKRSHGIVKVLNFFMQRFPALVLSTAVLWIWHIPRIYDAAVANEFLHGTEHMVFLVAFILFWRPLISDRTICKAMAYVCSIYRLTCLHTAYWVRISR